MHVRKFKIKDGIAGGISTGCCVNLSLANFDIDDSLEIQAKGRHRWDFVYKHRSK